MNRGERDMKKLTKLKDIASALNFGNYPVLSIDIANWDEYGLVGSDCRIDMGKFSSGEKWYQEATLRVFCDEKKLTFTSPGCCLSSTYSYWDFVKDVKIASAPIVKPNREIAVAVFDSKAKEGYGVYIVKTGAANRFCSTSLSCIDADMSEYISMVQDRYHRYEK